MFCFRFCCENPHEVYKDSVFLPADKEYSDNITKQQPSRGYIPWIWSRQFYETYRIGPKLGEGAYSVVHEATQIDPPMGSFAVKIYTRSRMSREHLRHFKEEVQILLDLKHENILRIHELYKVPQHFFIVMEKIAGGELFDRLCEKDVYSEMEARDVCRIIFEAMAYCHDNRVAHRDLKPENLLLLSKEDDYHIKIADFGFARRVPQPNCLMTRCGSAEYMAPEVVNSQRYDERADNWSVGVIVFTLLGGHNPFLAPTVHLTFQQIRQAAYVFHPDYWDGISPDAKNLIRQFLIADPERRLTCQKALQHAWMIGRGDGLRRHLRKNHDRLKEFNRKRTLDNQKRSKNLKSVSMFWLVARR